MNNGKQPAGSYASSSHTHDDRYYTESEVNNLLNGKQPAGSYAAASHTHDDRYYTKSEIDHDMVNFETRTDERITETNNKITQSADSMMEYVNRVKQDLIDKDNLLANDMARKYAELNQEINDLTKRVVYLESKI